MNCFTYIEYVGYQLSLQSVEVMSHSSIPDPRPLVLAAINDAARLGKQHDLYKVGHVAYKIVVEPFLI